MTTVPAVVLELLGGLTEADPPVVLGGCFGQGSVVMSISYQPHVDRKVTLEVDDQIRLPASNAALAAVVARHVGLDPSQGVSWTLTLTDGDFPTDFELVTDEDATCWFAPDGTPEEREIPTLAGITDPTLALALVACWLARTRRMLDRIAPNPPAETRSHGWTVEEMAQAERDFDLEPLEPTT